MNAPEMGISPVAARGIFFDGRTAARQEVAVELASAALRLRADDGTILAEWGYDELETLSAPDDVLRLGRAGNPSLARLEVKDPQLAAAIDERSAPVDRTGRIERRLRDKVIFWSVAATLSLVLVAVLGVPLLATALTPLVPYPLERKLGAAVASQARASLDNKRTGSAFECGNTENEHAGRAAFDKLLAQIEAAASLPWPLTVMIVRRPEANAITFPGGHIFVFEGLIKNADTPDELAGVLAHEVGHVAHHDGTRTVIQGAGLSLLFGVLLGDFVGGGAVILAAKTILRTSYSREVEAAADTYGVTLIARTGGDPRALGTILLRIAGTTHPGPKILADHPDTRDRVAAIEATATATPGARRALLDQTQWAALKAVCSRV